MFLLLFLFMRGLFCILEFVKKKKKSKGRSCLHVIIVETCALLKKPASSLKERDSQVSDSYSWHTVPVCAAASCIPDYSSEG